MSNFKTAFAAARKAGKKTFDWNGKSYNTKLAKGATGPKDRPSTVDAKGPMSRKVSGTTPPRRPSSVSKSFGTPSIGADNLGNLSQRTKNAEARAKARDAKVADIKSKSKGAAESLRKKFGFLK